MHTDFQSMNFSERNKSINNTESTQNNSPKKYKLWIIIGIFIGLLIILSIFLICFFIVKKKKDIINNIVEEKNDEKIDIKQEELETEKIENPNFVIQLDKVMKAFQPNFKISSKPNTLNQLLMKSNKDVITISNGIDFSYSIFTKALFDIYTLNETIPEKDKDYYSTKYTTVITINSLCYQYSSETECELEEYLNLNIKTQDNLRTNEEEIDDIKKAILPICIIEHTDTNLIISVTCPETLSINLKNDIILAFQIIKPDSIKGMFEDDNLDKTTITEKDDKIYIDNFSFGCDNYVYDPTKTENCEMSRNIITDKEGTVISSKKTLISEVIINENNKHKNKLVYFFENISNNNIGFDPVNYKSNLDSVFELINTFMKKEIYIIDGSFKDVAESLAKNEDDSLNSIRKLEEESINQESVIEETIFTMLISENNINLNIKNDIGLGFLEKAKASSNYIMKKSGNQTDKLLSMDEIDTKLNETINSFIKISKNGNKLASLLFQQINQPLLNLREIINTNINKLNNLLAFNDLLPIFEATLSIDSLEKLPYTFVTASENLYTSLNYLYNNIPYSLKDIKDKLVEEVSSFISDSHNLLYNIFKKLMELGNSLSSTKSKIAEVSSYYMNITNDSYSDTIENAKKIIDSYYIDELNLTLDSVNGVINEFSKNNTQSIKSIQTTLDKIVDNLQSGTLSIILASNEEIKQVINNLYNSKIKVNEIISNIAEILKGSINIQENGYFESEKLLEDNKNNYGKICEDAIEIANQLDNNLLIDKTFDNIMINYKEEFINILKHMEKSMKEKFSFQENILSSTFSEINDQYFNSERKDILQFIVDQNRLYLKNIQQNLNDFKNNDENKLNKITNDLQNEFSEGILFNIEEIYNKTLDSTFNSINEVIENNIINAIEYITNVKNSGTSHRTKAYENKVTIFNNNFNQIKTYVQVNLKNDLANKYKNVVDKMRSVLQNIKSNSILKKYANQFSFSETHLRVIDNLFKRLNEYISDERFNKYISSYINKNINKTLDNITKTQNNIQELYNSLLNLPYSSDSSYDYFTSYDYCWRACTVAFWAICLSHSTYCETRYQGHIISGSNNYKNLKNIELNNYTENFEIEFNEKYVYFNNFILEYNNILEAFDFKNEQEKEHQLKNRTNLTILEEKINSILTNKLETNLIISSYNYYKTELNKELPSLLNNILEEWNNCYDNVINDLNDNLNNFKYPITEFSFMGVIYRTIYSEDLISDYFNSIVNQRKKEFNYTIQYYYNYITSKINSTYFYILNNIYNNEEPFNDILNQRINEIKKSYENILTKLVNSKKEYLEKQKHEEIIKVSETNFFDVNSHLVKNIEDIDDQIFPKSQNIDKITKKLNKQNTQESSLAKFYLENAENDKQINDIYKPIDTEEFIDLKQSIYENILINKYFEIPKEEMTQYIKNWLIQTNNNLNNKFQYEIEKYLNILENKIYENYNKGQLDTEINTIFDNGLNMLDIQSKETIYNYINETLELIKTYISTETDRLSNDLTSYGNDFSVINNTINNYKKLIYNEFYTTILSVVDKFYNQILEKFYKNYIESNLEIFYKQTMEYKFTNKKILNITFDLDSIIKENVVFLINECKSTTKNKINLLYNIYVHQLDELFSFSNLEIVINNTIDTMYNSQLYPILNKTAIYNPNDVNVKIYDFSEEIKDKIKSFINEKINQTNILVKNETEGDNYIIKENWKIPDFSLVKIKEFKNITNLFAEFIQSNEQTRIFDEFLSTNLINNFNKSIEYFITSFVKDFFDRIINYNKFYEIDILYNNLKYSYLQSSVYYSILSDLHFSEVMPEDLKLKILNSNNLESILILKKEEIIKLLKKKLNDFLDETKLIIVEKYSNSIKEIKIEFEDNIKNLLVKRIELLDSNFKKEYVNMMNSYIINPFIEVFIEKINSETQDILDYIEDDKIELRLDLDNIRTEEMDDTLSSIHKKLDETKKAIEDYKSHLSFNLTNGIKNLLDNYGKNEIYKKFKDINDIIFKANEKNILEKLELNSEKYKELYSDNNFLSNSTEIKNYLNDLFSKLKNNISSYGYIDDVYRINLFNGDKYIGSKSNLIDIPNFKVDEALEKLKNSSKIIKKFIQNLNLFDNFEKEINKYKYDIIYQENLIENNIKESLYVETYKQYLSQLNDTSLTYYYNVNNSYYEIKQLIINSINYIDDLIEKCSDVTYKTILNEYKKIKGEYNSINENNNNQIEEISIDNKKDENEANKIENVITNYKSQNEIKFDIILEDNDIRKPKVIGKIINMNKPQKLFIDSYTQQDECKTLGRSVTATFKNVSLNMEIIFDVYFNEAKINSNFYCEKYNVLINDYTYKYTKKQKEGNIIFLKIVI